MLCRLHKGQLFSTSLYCQINHAIVKVISGANLERRSAGRLMLSLLEVEVETKTWILHPR
jgi:hypothetical protein